MIGVRLPIKFLLSLNSDGIRFLFLLMLISDSCSQKNIKQSHFLLRKTGKVRNKEVKPIMFVFVLWPVRTHYSKNRSSPHRTVVSGHTGAQAQQKK